MDHDIPAGLVNLADSSLGAEALWANDEFFAAKERMLDPAPPVSRPGTYDAHGQWMDGWETRRRRDPGHDSCILRLALRGAIRVLDLDTSFFTGNYPPQASVDATDDADPLAAGASWTPLLGKTDLGGDRLTVGVVLLHEPGRRVVEIAAILKDGVSLLGEGVGVERSGPEPLQLLSRQSRRGGHAA